MSRTNRLALLGAAIVVVIVLAIVLSGGGNDSSSKDAAADSGPATVVVKDGKPVGGIQHITFPKGGTVDLTVKSDTADEIHFHGYDVMKDVEQGGTAHFTFPADIEGRFEVELEDHQQQLAEVTVE
ncbi:MAG TPA: hypothetical protein VFT50_01195 [Baekduia sp.]|nr:hypothetical protein [Baekduia sp.]